MKHPAPEPLAPSKRIALLVLGYGIYVLSGPGILCRDGSALGLLGLVPWALAASRPGRRAFLSDWLVASVLISLQFAWMGYVFWQALPYVFPLNGLYVALGGALLRRLSLRLPLALAVPLAWTGWQMLRTLVPEPLGLEWLRLGHYAHATPWLLGSARVWGIVGLGFTLAACAGALADGWLWLRARRRPLWGRWALGLGALPLLLAWGFGLALPAPETEDGPRLLLVQPAFTQGEKSGARTGRDLFVASALLTRDALEAREGAPPLDLVCWGETMLYTPLIGPGLREACAEEGFEVAPWMFPSHPTKKQVRRLLADFELQEKDWVGGDLLGHPVQRKPAVGVLPPGTWFASGAEEFVAYEGALRRRNVLGLWNPAGERVGLAAKRHLAPGGETMVGLERFEWVREKIYEIARYVPDFLAGEETGVLPLVGRSGRRYAIGGTTCFDNAFIEVYTEPLRKGPLDFFLVVSNEAWYERSQEYDHMMAFTRLTAAATGRSIVRATNGGVSALVGADGRELARLEVDGEDRLVRGTLEVVVPVPTRGTAGACTPYVRSSVAWRWAGLLAPWILVLLFRLGERYSSDAKG